LGEIGIWAGGTRVFMKSALFRLNFYKHKTNYAYKLCKNASFAAAVALAKRQHRFSRRTHRHRRRACQPAPLTTVAHPRTWQTIHATTLPILMFLATAAECGGDRYSVNEQ